MADVRSPRTSWIWGGALLIVSAVLPLAVPHEPVLSSVVWWIAALAFAAATGVFALGRDSVVARRSLGATALLVLGAWPLVVRVAEEIVPDAFWLSPDGALWGQALGYTDAVVSLATALVAAVQVARAGAVPERLRWLPLVAVAIVAVPRALAYVAYAAPADALLPVAMVLGSLMALANVVAVAGLGVVAIVAGLQPPRRAEASVPVFASPGAAPERSAPSEVTNG